MIVLDNFADYFSEAGFVLIRTDQANSEHRVYTFLERSGKLGRTWVQVGPHSSVNSTLVVSRRRSGTKAHKISFSKDELALDQPRADWSIQKRFTWYVAKHFVETNAHRAKDTSRRDQIAKLQAEADRIQERIDQIRAAEIQCYMDAPNPKIPEAVGV